MNADLESILDSLGPARRFADPGANIDARLMAAGGALPLAPPQIVTVLYLLAQDDDAGVKEKAARSLENLPDRVVDTALGGSLHPAPLAYLAERFREDGQIVFAGYADVRRPQGWLLQGIYTWPDERRRGHAAVGTSDLCREAFAADADHVQLAVVESNAAAVEPGGIQAAARDACPPARRSRVFVPTFHSGTTPGSRSCSKGCARRGCRIDCCGSRLCKNVDAKTFCATIKSERSRKRIIVAA